MRAVPFKFVAVHLYIVQMSNEYFGSQHFLKSMHFILAVIFECDFETDPCDFSHYSGDINWLRARGATSTPDTGPDMDHTNGQGT